MQKSVFSRYSVASFVKKMDIDLSEAERDKISQYRSFNDFFTRKLKPEARPLPADSGVLVSPADGRLLAYEYLEEANPLQIKGQSVSLEKLCMSGDVEKSHKRGSVVIVRLSPADYHRFHFPADGVTGHTTVIKGKYYSVNPLSLEKNEGVFFRNSRQVTCIDTFHYGRIIMVEVGATFVGSIVQTFAPGMPVTRGTEKGYFQFGGSTVILIFQKDRVRIDTDLLRNTKEGFETDVKMGESIGARGE